MAAYLHDGFRVYLDSLTPEEKMKELPPMTQEEGDINSSSTAPCSWRSSPLPPSPKKMPQ